MLQQTENGDAKENPENIKPNKNANILTNTTAGTCFTLHTLTALPGTRIEAMLSIRDTIWKQPP